MTIKEYCLTKDGIEPKPEKRNKFDFDRPTGTGRSPALECRYCKKDFNKPTSLQRHLINAHLKLTNKLFWKDIDNKFRCKICNDDATTFSHAYKLGDHIRDFNNHTVTELCEAGYMPWNWIKPYHIT